MSANLIPDGVAFLLADFGQISGIDDLVFDAEGRCFLQVEDVDVELCYLSQVEAILIQIAVGFVPIGPKPSYFATLMIANHTELTQGYGSLSIGSDDGYIYYSERAYTRHMSAGELVERLVYAARRSKFWQAQLRDLLEENGARDAAPSEEVPVATNGEDFLVYKL